MPSEYSGTPLAKKLGLKKGFRLSLYRQPSDYFMLFSDLPEDLVLIDELEIDIDFIHLFCTEFTELKSILPDYKNALKKDGTLWVSWPKGKSTIPTDLKRDLIREHILEQGLVDVKIASINDNWSALKFVYRLKDR